MTTTRTDVPATPAASAHVTEATKPAATITNGPLSPGVLLRLEGLALLGASAVGYAHLGGSWLLFAALFLVPDVGMVGYAVSVRLGARAYNATHRLVPPAALGGLGLAIAPALLPYALIWTAHIGFDRALGYGLKYPTSFTDTHLQRVA